MILLKILETNASKKVLFGLNLKLVELAYFAKGVEDVRCWDSQGQGVPGRWIR